MKKKKDKLPFHVWYSVKLDQFIVSKVSNTEVIMLALSGMLTIDELNYYLGKL